jgi:predicted RecB family nuclease
MAKIEYSKKYEANDGTILPGVTTILGNLGWNKSILMAWAAKMERQNKNYKEESKEAAEIGTLAHALAEAYLNEKPVDPAMVAAYSPVQIGKANNAIVALQEWQKISNLAMVHTEVNLVSNTHRYGGSADIIFTNKEGDFELADIKSGNGTYADYILQLAAYAKAAEETLKRPVKRIHILRFGKNKSATFHHSSWGQGDIDLAFKVFLHLIAIHYLRPEIEELL